ncbi:MAG: hypothetical protein JW771_05815 [Candidatus Thermoplasmatota archaeon]|nr:hypothetical protein [Candidatus Thermoplasmatota archaeon]
MKASCEVSIKYAASKKAKLVLRAIEVDNLDFVKAKIKNTSLHARIESNSVSSLLHTLDDYLACVSVAEKIVDKH